MMLKFNTFREKLTASELMVRITNTITIDIFNKKQLNFVLFLFPQSSKKRKNSTASELKNEAPIQNLPGSPVKRNSIYIAMSCKIFLTLAKIETFGPDLNRLTDEYSLEHEYFLGVT